MKFAKDGSYRLKPSQSQLMDSIFSHFSQPNNPFELFGAVHLWMVVYVLVFGFVLLRVGVKATEDRRKVIRRVIALVFLFWEIEWQVWHIWHGVWSSSINLPLHLCSLMIWVTLYSFWFDDKRFYGAIYFFGIAGAIQAIITPNAAESFPHIRFLSTMFTHSLLVISGLWVVIVEKYRPTIKAGVQCFVGLNVAAFVIYWINVAIGSNYMYVVDKPAVATVMDYFPAWPWYIPILEGILVVLMVLLLLPFMRKGPASASAA